MKKNELLKVAKPILFSTEMVRAIMDGTKSCTRRIVKPRSIIGLKPDKCKTGMPEELVKEKKLLFIPYCNMSDSELVQSAYKNKYEVGDILYIRETWMDYAGRIMYKADCDEYRIDSLNFAGFDWHPSIHMPKEAARIFLKITGVRAERLQDITEEEAVKEGCQAGHYEYQGAIWGQEDTDEWTAVEDFERVWYSTLKKTDIDKYDWDANPWVWVYDFEVVKIS